MAWGFEPLAPESAALARFAVLLLSAVLLLLFGAPRTLYGATALRVREQPSATGDGADTAPAALPAGDGNANPSFPASVYAPYLPLRVRPRWTPQPGLRNENTTRSTFLLWTLPSAQWPQRRVTMASRAGATRQVHAQVSRL